MTKSKLITVLSDYHQKEYSELSIFYDYCDYDDDTHYMIPALNSRMSWLECQAKLKVESILNLCKTGK